MKEFKRKLCLLLTLAMIISTWTVPAFADNVIKYGSITVYNAEYGRTYKIYKLFDLTQDNESLGYSTTNAKLGKAIYAEREIPLDPSNPGSVCPFTTGEEEPYGDVYPITHKDRTKDAAGKGWLKNNYATWSEGMQIGVDYWEATADESCTVFFDHIPYGYYLMATFDPDSDVMRENVTVTNVFMDPTSHTDAIRIFDKNNNLPSNLEKKAEGLDSKDVPIGKQVHYSFKFLAKNYYTVNEGAKQITKYEIKDIANGLRLDDLGSLSIKRYQEDDTECEGTGIEIATHSQSSSYHSGQNTLRITIPWVDNAGNSMYPSPVWVKVEYDMIVDEMILATLSSTVNGKNTVEVDYYYGTGDAHETVLGATPSERLFTSGISVGKRKNSFDEDAGIRGAWFILYKVEDGVNKYYQWATSSDGRYYYPEWVLNKDDATVMEADNSYETVEFKGLTAGNYYLKETKAPDGFTPPEEPFAITITFNGGDAEYIYTGQETGTPSGKILIQNQKNKNYITVLVRNDADNRPLPSTGGAGTILLIAGGSILFLAAGLILVTKKRMYNEEA